MKISLVMHGLRLVEFHVIAEMHAFHGEDDHGGGGGRRRRNDYNFAYGAARKIGHVDYRASGLGQHVGIDGGLVR